MNITSVSVSHVLVESGAAVNASNVTLHRSDGSTISSHLEARWTFVPLFNLITSLIGFLANSALVVVFLRESLDRERTSAFNIYVLNVLLVNLFTIIVSYPMQVISTLYSSAWFLGESACTLLNYGWYALEGVVMNSHAFIAIVRVWAIVHPISYRNLHSGRFAFLSCAGVWIWVHIIILPGVILDAWYYRLPSEIYGCMLNSEAQKAWATAIIFVIYTAPWIVILLALPAVLFAHVLRGANMVSTAGSTPNRTTTTIMAKPAQDEIPVGLATTKPLRQKRSSKKYIMLILLTISVSVFWSPGMVYYAILNFGGTYSENFYEIIRTLFSCQLMVDPLLFALSFARIRLSLQRFVKCLQEMIC